MALNLDDLFKDEQEEPKRTPLGNFLSALGKGMTQTPINMENRGWESNLAASIGAPLGAGLIGSVLGGRDLARSMMSKATPELYNTPQEKAKYNLDMKKQLQLAEVKSALEKATAITPDEQIKVFTDTQKKLRDMGINAKIDVTATGVPTISTQPELGLTDLTPEQQVQAISLAKKIATGRNMNIVVPSIAAGLRSGKTIDVIEDELRSSGQSKEFTGPLRSAAQQIMAGKSTDIKQTTFDDLDDLQGQPNQQKSYLKRMALKEAPAGIQDQVFAKERTIEFLNQIKGDLATLEKNGVSTNIFTGNLNSLANRVGTVYNPEMQKIATKIAVAVMNYRRSMTGVQFGMKENAEYFRIFPNIKKMSNFNTASINGLEEAFKGDVDNFYSRSMGEDNYKKLFGDGTKQPEKTGTFKVIKKVSP